MINEFDNTLDKDSLRYRFKIEFENNTLSGKDTHLDDIMFYNDILDHVERENNNCRKILSHSLISGKNKKDDKIKIQMVWEIGATSIKCFESLKKDIPVNLAIFAKENNILELDGWKTLKISR